MYSFVKDRFVKTNLASISIEERGFKYSDGFFNTILISNYQPYQWIFHKAKIITALKTLCINIEFNKIENIAKEIIYKNNIKEGLLRISISRGMGSIGYLPKNSISPTLIIETSDITTTKNNIAKLWLSNYKKIPKECFDPNMKLMNATQSVLIRLEASHNGCDEGLLLDHNNNICEGSSSNIFWLKDNKIYTPSSSLGIYNGSIRESIINITNGSVIEGNFQLDHLLEAEEIFICNVAWKIRRVSEILPINKKFSMHKQTNELLKLLNADIKEKTRQEAWSKL